MIHRRHCTVMTYRSGSCADRRWAPRSRFISILVSSLGNIDRQNGNGCAFVDCYALDLNGRWNESTRAARHRSLNGETSSASINDMHLLQYIRTYRDCQVIMETMLVNSQPRDEPRINHEYGSRSWGCQYAVATVRTKNPWVLRMTNTTTISIGCTMYYNVQITGQVFCQPDHNKVVIFPSHSFGMMPRTRQDYVVQLKVFLQEFAGVQVQ